ncbi:Microsomal glutathione S-transferase 3 [Borealophlyctis nickersoniae]|nr:Microsomal glutathione S-transferase 3 [Borealophlyctis nickersoniae]
MALTITLTPQHGYVVGVALTSVILLRYMGAKVGMMRKKAKVPYPYLYADRSEAEKDPVKKTFNCYQRAHQNTLETYPEFLILLATAAIEHPTFAAACGGLWIAGRFFYAQGYYTGDPEKRQRGAFMYFGVFGLLGASVKTAIALIQGK